MMFGRKRIEQSQASSTPKQPTAYVVVSGRASITVKGTVEEIVARVEQARTQGVFVRLDDSMCRYNPDHIIRVSDSY